MVTLADAVQVLYPNAIALKDFVVNDVKGVQSIGFWNESVLGPKPKDAELAAITQEQVDSAKESKEQAIYPEKVGLRNAAANAISNIDTFLGLASPGNAQVLAMVQNLAQQNKKIINRLLEQQ